MGDYYLGLSLDPTAVGWAVTDENYRIIRRCGKDMWGTHGFDRANTAEERRNARESRRRIERRKARIGMLRSYFSDAIDAVDPDFFIRLDNSKYFQEDKNSAVRYRHVLFHDDDYTDVDYKREYPTVFHLRKALLDLDDTGRAFDVRLVYLALANMFKHRGNFYMNISADAGGLDHVGMQCRWDALQSTLSDLCGITFPQVPVSAVTDVLSDDSIGKRQKALRLQELLCVGKGEKGGLAVVKCLCGSKIDARWIFTFLDSETKVELNFGSSSYADSIPELELQLGEANYDMVCLLKEIYDYAALQTILRGNSYMSIAQVDCYERHADDLRCLKEIYRKYLPQEAYKRMFCSSLPGTYSAYVGSLRKSGKRVRRGVGGSRKKAWDMQQEMYRTIKKDLSACPADDEQVMHVLSCMDCGTFLLKQRTDENSVIPNQVYAAEMKRILECAGRYLPFLNEKDDSGMTVSARILALFSFCMPYYVGPVGKGSKTGWAVLTDNPERERILPWNIHTRVDMQKTQEAFIKNLVRSCTYIANEKVLPKASLAYEKFMVLNVLNTLCIDGERISTSLKQRLYMNLFLAGGRPVTKKTICSYLVKNGDITSADQISGVPDVIGYTLSSYRMMKEVFKERLDTPEGMAVAEGIIYWGTVYGESRSMYRKYLKDLRNEGKLTREQMSLLMNCRFKDWGKLSEAFLHLQGKRKPTSLYPVATDLTVMDALWEYSLNLMEIIYSDAFTFRHELEKRRVNTWKTLTDIEMEDLDELGLSAPVRRMVWRVVLVTREVVDVMGAAPKRVFVQMARANTQLPDRNRDIETKKAFLLQAYKEIPDTDTHKWKAEIEAAAESGILARKKVYLYFCQMGYDLYTGKEIPFSSILEPASTEYNIDHIYPQRYVMDSHTDNNMVLVDRFVNASVKGDRYPVPMEIWDNSAVRKVWDMLHRHGLMNDEKYRRLTSRKPFDDQKLGDFIVEQMVEVGQGSRSVAALLKDLLPPSTDIVTVKGANVSAFRQKFDFSRLCVLNEAYHAQDAFLNVVVGNVFFVKFTRDPWQFIRKEYVTDRKKYHYNLSKIFDHDVYRDGYLAWDSGLEGTICMVQKMMNRTSMLLTHMTMESRGSLAKATIYPASQAKNKGYYPVKASDPALCDVTRYGGVTAASTAYFFLVSHEKKQKRILCIEPLPAFYRPMAEKDPDWLKQYCEKNLGYEQVRILNPKIRIYSVLEINGYRMYLSGKSGASLSVRNAEQMFLPHVLETYVRRIEKHAPLLTAVYRRKPKELPLVNLHDRELSVDANLSLYDALTDKYLHTLFANRPNAVGEKLLSDRENFAKLSIPEQCYVLYQMLRLSRIGTTVADMSLVGDAQNFGIMSLNQKLNCERDRIYLISQSVTGLKCKRTRLTTDMENTFV